MPRCALSETIRLDSRTKLLNPKWYEGMLDSGYEGVREVAKRLNFTLGWSATGGAVDNFVYEEPNETFINDPEMRKRLLELNPNSFRQIVGTLLEVHGRGYWKTSDENIEQLQELYQEVEDRISVVTDDAAGSPEGLSHANGLGHRAHIVHAHDVDPSLSATADHCSGPPDASRRSWLVEHRPNETFARRAHQQWESVCFQCLKALEQGQVLFMGFGKAKTGVPDDLRWLDTGGQRRVRALQQRQSHIVDNIPVVGELVHGAAVAAAMHQHHRATAFGDN